MTRMTLQLPDDIAHGLTAKRKDLPRAAEMLSGSDPVSA